MKKSKLTILTVLMIVFALVAVACGPAKPATTTKAPVDTDAPATDGPATDAPETEAPEKTDAPETEPATTDTEKADEPSGDKPYIAVVSKGFQHQFWQAVYAGSQAAADEYGVEITFEGPPSETDVAIQTQMLNSALAKNPVAVAFAALSTEAVTDQLEQALADKIPVIGFDSGVPDAPAGSIHATASTNNNNAGGIGADHLYEAVKDKLAEGTTDSPIRIAVISQDAISESITGRTQGFVDRFVELVKEGGIETVAVVGHDKFATGAEADATVLIDVGVAADTNPPAVKTATEALLNKENVVGIFGSNEAAAKGILDATNNGVDLEDMGVIAVGFDAGAPQKAAVAEGYFLGSVTQDPFQIGYKAVELAYKAYKGETVEDVDTGAKFYDKDNMEDEDIALLLYD